ncbi:MAG: UDP-2,3-diacylglucosamine diphosphatase LpxI [Pseudomonadota bacterium]|nr:UDP-2,3-diacylglucosamine diphosphatase LpxI [Pseudomonadota bacterium]
MTQPLALVCGAGSLPLEAAREVRGRGREVFMVGLIGSAGREIEAFPHLWVRLGEVGKLLAALRARGVSEILFLGAVTRPDLGDLLPDWGAIVRAGEIAKLFRGGDDALLRGVAQLFESEGFRIVGPRDVAPGLFAPKGEIVGPIPDEEARADIAFGARLLEAMSPYDIGQGAVISAERALAIEAAEGTDNMLARVAELRVGGRLRLKGRAGVFVKAAKRGQDVRLDLPAVGPATIAAAKKAQLVGLAIAAGEVLIADRPAFAKAAEQAGLFVYGWPA